MRFEGIREEEMAGVAAKLLATCPGNVIALSGNLGAGKTTLARAMLQGLGHEGRVMSPTFIIACEYRLGGKICQHLDFYRVEDYRLLVDLGLEEMLETADLLLIEWAEKFLEELRQSGARGWHVTLADDGRGGRDLHVEEL